MALISLHPMPEGMFTLLTPAPSATQAIDQETIISTVATVTQSAPTPSYSSYNNFNQFESDMVDGQNFFRREHNVTDLVWNQTSASYAADYSGQCQFKHSVCICLPLPFSTI